MKTYYCDVCSDPLPLARYSVRIAFAARPWEPARSAGSEADLCLSCYQTFARRLADWLAEGQATHRAEAEAGDLAASLN